MTETSTPDAPTTSITTPFLIDTHTHLDDPDFADDLDAVIAQSRDAGVSAWINVGYEPSRWSSTIDLATRIPGMRHMLGMHPSSADQWSATTERELRRLLIETGAVAIGEIGLDFLRDHAPRDAQFDAFQAQLDLAEELDLPAVIHMRDAEAALLDVLTSRSTLPPLLLHSYDGGRDLTDHVITNGVRIGVGGLATRQKSEALREQIARVPLEQIVLETDSPYLVPARQKIRRNTPVHVRTIAQFLADLRETDLDTIARTTTQNALTFFRKLSLP